ncbi:MAG: DUF2330 domain-containing protein [Candidatus Eisenbacteria bacterium]|nr:DUF2330 domain-containing protein [Candidatus Eisenbacteria bacterium]
MKHPHPLYSPCRRTVSYSGASLLLGAGLAATLFIAAMPPSPARALNFPIPQAGKTLSSQGQLLVLRFDRTANQVQMIPNLRFSGKSEEFAVVIPTPELPALRNESPDLWAELRSLTGPASSSGGYRRRTSIGCQESGSTSPPPDAPYDVFIHANRQVGALEATVLSSENPNALVDWLTAHGFSASPELSARIAPYVEQGWYFTVMRPIPSDPQNEMPPAGWDSTVAPVSFTWSGSRLELPLALLDINRASPFPVIAYVIDDHRITLDRFETQYANLFTADEIRGCEERYPRVAALLTEGQFLTRLVCAFGRNEEMVGDVPATPAEGDEELRLLQSDGLWFAGDLGLLVLAGMSTLLDGLRRQRRAQGLR